jgi:hypothetical protein
MSVFNVTRKPVGPLTSNPGAHFAVIEPPVQDLSGEFVAA